MNILTPKLSIVIPAYNEEKRLSTLLQNLEYKKLSFPYEIIIVLDGCKDNSIKVALAWQNKLPIKIIDYFKNGGKAYAIKKGVELAMGNIIAFMDADGATDLANINLFLDKINKENFDIAIGSRKIKGAEIEKQPLYRHLLGIIFPLITKLFLGLNYLDTQCGYKFFKKDVAKYLFKNCKSNGFEFDFEILFLAAKNNFKTIELPVKWADKEGSKVNPVKDGFKMLKTVIKMRFEDLSKQKATNLWIFIILVLFARLIATAFMPMTDPTEGRYASVALEMLRSGHWLPPTVWIDGALVPFNGKPPLFFWASALSIKTFGINNIAPRLPNLIAFLFIIHFMWTVIKRYYDENIAFKAIFFSLASVVFFGAIGFVIVDIFLTLSVSCAIIAYWAFSKEQNKKIRKKWSILVFVMLAIGFMTKGPIAVIMFGMPVFLWTLINKKWADLKYHSWVLGGSIFILLTVPWFIAQEIHSPGFLKYFFINENLLRFLVHDYGDKYGYGHIYMRGSAIWMMIVSAFPISIIAINKLFKNRKKISFKNLLSSDEVSLFALAVVSITLFWSLSRQLLITYLFPTVPLFAIWFAVFLSKTEPKYDFIKLSKKICVLSLAIFFVLGPILARTNSSKNIIKIAQEKLGNDVKVYFIHKIPYSARFYFGDILINHPDLSVKDSMKKTKCYVGTKKVCIVKNKYFDRISTKDKKNLNIIYRYGNHRIFQINEQTI